MLKIKQHQKRSWDQYKYIDVLSVQKVENYFENYKMYSLVCSVLRFYLNFTDSLIC